MNGLYDFYSSDLRPVLIEQERSRKRVFANIRFNLIVAVLGSIILAPLAAIWLTEEGLGFREALMFTSLLSVGYIIAVYKTIVKYHRNRSHIALLCYVKSVWSRP